MKPPPAGRFLPIDAMRGIAALSVLVFHLLRNSPQTEVLNGTFPDPVKAVADYSRSGVAIFFVISGFVIAYTTRNLGARVRDGIRFSVRRQVRLDPPYYFVLFGVLCVGVVENVIPGLSAPSFSIWEILLNMFYLQGIAGAPSVLAVAWTLCLEVQFYLFIVVLVIMSGLLVRKPGAGRQRVVRYGALAMGAVSLGLHLVGVSSGAWFVDSWWMFCLGMVVCWYMTGAMSRTAVLTVLGIVAVWCATLDVIGRGDQWGGEWFAWLAGMAILLLVMTGKMSWRPPRWLLFFGGISYSLYLVHLPVIDVVMGAGYKLTGDSRIGALAFCVLGAGVSIILAAGVRRFIERPAMKWSEKLKTVNRASISRARRRSANDSPNDAVQPSHPAATAEQAQIADTESLAPMVTKDAAVTD